MLRILNIRLSRCTVLSQLMRVPFPPLGSRRRVLRVDDFALYGDTYGTLLADATTLWAGRDAEQLGFHRRPTGSDSELYKRHNEVERSINRLHSGHAGALAAKFECADQGLPMVPRTRAYGMTQNTTSLLATMAVRSNQ